MGITLTQYRAAIGLWRRGPAQSKVSCTMNYSEPLYRENINSFVGLINMLCLVCIAVSNSLAMDQSLSATLMSRQCLQALLLISGVEQNPGPMSTQSIIEDLISKTSNDVIKKVLTAYPVGRTLKQQNTVINRFKKEELIATAEFLKLTNQDKYNKEQVVHNLIIRIQNLLPDTCGLCKQEHHTSLDDTPLLSCEVCGQGSHNSCIISLLGIEEDDLSSFDPQTARKMIIPLELPGVHYMCMTCSNDNIPDDNDGIIKKMIQDIPEVEDNNSLPPETVNVASVLANSSGPVESQTNSEAVSVSANASRPVESQTQPSLINDESQPQSHQSQSSNQGRDERPICHFFKKGQCKHGITGRGCKDLHPTPCKKLIRHGAKTPNGCTLGRARCEKFHPNMCPSSMTKGVCTDSSCKLWHVAGTRKIHQNETLAFGNPKGAESLKTNPTPPKGTSDDFLGLLQSWKAEMMEAMDTKLAIALKASVIPSPRPPAMVALPMMAQNHVLPQNYYNPYNLSVGGQRGIITSGQPVLLQMAPNVMYY